MKKAVRRGIWTAVIIVTISILAVLEAPKIIEREIQKKAVDMGISLKFEDISLALDGVELKNVRAISIKSPDRHAEIENIRVEIGSNLHPKKVKAKGGSISFKNLDSFRDLKNENKDEKKEKISIDAQGLSVHWDGVAEADGVNIFRDSNGKVMMEIGKASLMIKNLIIKAEEIHAEIGTEPKKIRAKKIRIEYDGKFATTTTPVTYIKNDSEKSQLPEFETQEIEIIAAGHEAHLTKIIAKSVDHIMVITAENASIDGKIEAMGIEAKIEGNREKTTSQMRVKTLRTAHKSLTDKEITAKDITLDSSMELKAEGKGKAEGTVRIEKAEVSFEANWDLARIEARLSMPVSSCEDVFTSIPEVMVEKLLPQTEMTGELSWELQTEVDLPDRKEPKVRIKLRNGCKITAVPEIFRISGLKKPFRRTIYGPNGQPKEVVTGPGSQDWIPLQVMSRYIPLAVRATEDPGFWAHRGIDILAMENSMIENIRSGRFSRGASTVTMQLAKNLWLYREKTMARKLQELILTVYLEQNLPKEKILELYLNIIEFGPDIYGIGPASEYYFGISPINLSLSQSIFLTSILPKPNASYFGSDGKLTSGRLFFLRKIMKIMLDRQWISAEEFREGTGETPMFGKAETAQDGKSETVEGGIDPSDWN